MAIGTDILNDVIQGIDAAGATASNSILHALYPNEFELYMVSLELVNSKDETEDYFTFPITPNSISKTENFTKSIERANGVIVVNKTGLFTPQDIIIKGNFGKVFKILLRDKDISFSSILKVFSGKTLLQKNELSPFLKNGYGSFKVLQDICSRSDEIEDGRPKQLYFHNFVLGESYLVEVLDFSSDMTLQSNMIWNYTLRMRIITTINIDRKSRIKMITVGGVQKVMTNTLSSVSKIINELIP